MYKIRKRRIRLLFLLFLMLAFFYFWYSPEMDNFRGDKPVIAVKKNPEPVKPVEPEEKKPIDRSGEDIIYDVMLGKMRLGTAHYHHDGKAQINGRSAELITFETNAVKFRDLETIYCDAGTFLPLVVERRVSQPIKAEKIREEYDQTNFVLNITRKRFTEEHTVIRKDGPIHNSILLPFFVRNAPELAPGWSFTANLPQRTYLIKLVGIEPLEVPAGRFNAYYFESEPRQIKIWISADDKRIPLKIEGTGGIGYKLLMREYQPPRSSSAGGKS
ncbi:MAG: DUF3108 domain-containing protein [Candidatus Omnitrophica bacterium]|nr:DUF3108 domain-containing protein [Candidatus Omnitrophota bacterium]